ncbi:MAG: hypothetical protein OXG88_12080 [Gammaproteobacteria bacterium]|nr:hypothetical protein [Gammaproteobacteria bacterium]
MFGPAYGNVINDALHGASGSAFPESACESWGAWPAAPWTHQRQQTPPTAHPEERSAVTQGSQRFRFSSCLRCLA